MQKIKCDAEVLSIDLWTIFTGKKNNVFQKRRFIWFLYKLDFYF